jgi:hypothetical protein
VFDSFRDAPVAPEENGVADACGSVWISDEIVCMYFIVLASSQHR